MSELSCAVVRDLAALYTDNAASEETAGAVRAHLEGCRDCRKYYKEYKKSGANRSSAAAHTACGEPGEAGYAALAARMRRRGALEKGGAVLGALLLAAAAFGTAWLIEKDFGPIRPRD